MESSTPRFMLEQARAASAAGRSDIAAQTLQSLLTAAPDFAEAWYEFGFVLKAAAEYERALDAYGQAISTRLERAEEAHVNRGVIYSDHLRRDDEAQQELEQALSLNPSYMPALLNLGNLYEEKGRKEDALAMYRRARDVHRAGNAGQDAELALEALARHVRLDPPTSLGHPVVGDLIHAATMPASTLVRANVLFALGQTYDRHGEVTKAFDAFAKANRWLIRGSGRPYDRARVEAGFDALIQNFPSAAPARNGDDAGPQPLFICGMFRSGSTLLEQVLAAHSEVAPGGELVLLQRLAYERFAPFPDSMPSRQPDELIDAADEYRRHLAATFPGTVDKRYISDKRPDNFLLIGLIKALFPNAKIVHTTRSPADTGLSIFMQHLHLQVSPYSADLSDIAHYYAQYRRLMRHWSTLYPDDILDFNYDAFVESPRAGLERVLNFLHLAWHDDCLRFHELRNTVKTASYWQVRQPLNANAIGRWKRYETHLGPLLAGLREAGIDP